MALIIEDGTGLPDAESYASVAAADAYHAGRGQAGWTGTEAAKEAALRRATTFIDSLYRGRWAGKALKGRDQALAWPRTGAIDSYGDEIDDASVPKEIVQATMEAALRELTAPGSLSPDIVQTDRIRREKVGELEVEYADVDGASASRPVLTIVEELLSALIVTQSRTVASLVRRF